MFDEFYRRLTETEPFRRVIQSLESDQETVIHSLAGSLCAWMAGALARYTGRTWLLVIPDDYAHIVQDDLEECLPPDRVILFPARDIGLYDDFLSDHQVMTQRMLALYRILHDPDPLVVITTPSALWQKIIPCPVFRKSILEFRPEDEILLELVVESVQDLGYTRSDMVRLPGDYAVRGGLIDFFPPHASWPVRLEFFGDTIDSIRGFDPITQRSLSQSLDSITVYPTHEAVFQAYYINLALETLKREIGDHYQSLFEKLKDKINQRAIFPGIEKYLYYYYGGELGSLIDYLPSNRMIYWMNPGHCEKSWHETWSEAESHYSKKISLDPYLPQPGKIMFPFESFLQRLSSSPRVNAFNFGLVSSHPGIEYSSALTGSFANFVCGIAQRF